MRTYNFPNIRMPKRLLKFNFTEFYNSDWKSTKSYMSRNLNIFLLVLINTWSY